MGKTDRDSRRRRRETKKEGLSSVTKQTSQSKCARRTKTANTSSNSITRTKQEGSKEKAVLSSSEFELPLSQIGKLIPKFCKNVKPSMKANKNAQCKMKEPEKATITNETPVDNFTKDTEKESEEITCNECLPALKIVDTVSGDSIQESKMSVRAQESAPVLASSMPVETEDGKSFDLLKPSSDSAMNQENTQSSTSMVHLLNSIHEKQIGQPNEQIATLSVGQKADLLPYSNKRVHENESFVCSVSDSATTVLTNEGTRPLEVVCHQGNDSSVMSAAHTELKFLPSEEAVCPYSHSACNSYLEPADHNIDQDRAETADDHEKQHESVIEETSERNGVPINEDKKTCFSNPSACTPIMPVDTAHEEINVPQENINEDLIDTFNDFEIDVKETLFKIVSHVEYKQNTFGQVKDSPKEDEILVPCPDESNSSRMMIQSLSLTHFDKTSIVEGEQQNVKIEKYISNEANQGIQFHRGLDTKLQTTESVMDCNPMQSTRITSADSGVLKMKAPISNCARNENSVLKEGKNGESLAADDDTDNFVTPVFGTDRNPISCVLKRDVSQNTAIDTKVENEEHGQDSVHLQGTGTTSIHPSGQQLQHTGLSHQNGQDMFESSCTDELTDSQLCAGIPSWPSEHTGRQTMDCVKLQPLQDGKKLGMCFTTESIIHRSHLTKFCNVAYLRLTSGFAESAVKSMTGAFENGDEILMPVLTSLSKLNALVLSAYRTSTELRNTRRHQSLFKPEQSPFNK